LPQSILEYELLPHHYNDATEIILNKIHTYFLLYFVNKLANQSLVCPSVKVFRWYDPGLDRFNLLTGQNGNVRN